MTSTKLSKKPTPKKKSPIPRSFDKTKTFEKDWERLTESGRYDMSRLKEVMLLLIANDGPLPPEWKDHPLTGEWEDHRECHVGGDFLLIYQLEKQKGKEVVVFVRSGTHAELFK